MPFSQWLILWVQCAVCCGCIAHYKGRNVVGWVALGFCTAILGVAILLFMPRKDEGYSGERWSALELWAFGLPLSMSLSLIIFLSAQFIDVNLPSSNWRESNPIWAEAIERYLVLKDKKSKIDAENSKLVDLPGGRGKNAYLKSLAENEWLNKRFLILSRVIDEDQTLKSFLADYKEYKKNFGEVDRKQ